MAVVLAVAIGLAAYYNGQGYVAISFADYTFETTFVFVMGVIALSFVIFYYFLRVFSRLLYFMKIALREHWLKV